MRKVLPILVILLLLLGVAHAAAPSLCTISGTVYNADGSPDINDTIAIFPNPSTQVINGNAITAQPKSVQTDASGNVAAFTLVQGLTVNVTLHNNTAAAITTFVPNSPASAFGNFIAASTSITPVSFCATPVVFAGLPLTPQIGSTCTVTDATACNNGVPVTVGGGSTVCQLTWVGSNWFPAGNASLAATFPLATDADFNNYSGINVNQIALQQLAPPSSVTATGTCSGTCATTYTYEVTCLSDAETSPSATATAVNASALSGSNFNVINWSPGKACYNGYNLYGRISGSLALLATVPSGTMTYTDTGTVMPGGTYTISFNKNALPAAAIWDLRGAQGWIDTATTNANLGPTLTATGFTSPVNHDLEMPIFAFASNGGTFTPPGSFSNTISVAGVSGVKSGLWGGTKDLSTAGVVANQTGTIPNSASDWATLHFSITPASTSSAVTIVGKQPCAPQGSGTSIICQDPAGTLTGDLEVICVSWGSFNQGTFPSNPIVPGTFNILGSAGVGVPGQVFGANVANVACYANAPNASATGVTPPTVNKTGTLQQTATTGNFEETLLGIQQWTANSGNLPNGSANALASTSFPMTLTVMSCRATWNSFAGCSPFPTFAIRDATANVDLCSSGTVGGGNTSQVTTTSGTVVPANDILSFYAPAQGTSCTAGLASMSIIFKE